MSRRTPEDLLAQRVRPALSPEFGLVAACCGRPISVERRDTIETAASRPLDWDRVLRVAEHHGVVALVHEALARTSAPAPAPFRARLAARVRTLVAQNFELASEAVRLHRLFVAGGIPARFLKGVTLAVLAHGNVALRQAKDIDVLVPPEASDAATRILRAAGYRRREPPAEVEDAQVRRLWPLRKDSAHVHDDGVREVELHWRLFDNPHLMAATSASTSVQVIRLLPGVDLPTLGEEDLFAYVCAHGASHCWYRFKWVSDVGGLLAAVSQHDVERLYGAAVSRGVGAAAAQALLLCGGLLGTPLPAGLHARLRADVRARWLERIGLWAMRAGNDERALPELPFGGTRILLAQYLLRGGWRYGLAQLRIQLTHPDDMVMAPLPERLHFLYPALRVPLWMCRKVRGRLR